MKQSKINSFQFNPELVKKLAQKINEELGLNFLDKLEELNKILIKYFRMINVSGKNSSLERLLNTSITQIPEFVNLLTVSETYFFRNSKLFQVLENRIMPGLLESKSEQNDTFTIWSAGCATGEEAYSLAMILDQLKKRLSHGVKIEILATDVNKENLKKAQKGVYSNWSFRTIPLHYQESYFKPIDHRHFQISPHIKNMVTFKYHNLVQDPFPPDSRLNFFDLIICRNVLIYFDKKNLLQVLQKFSNVLSDEGYFISGPAEIPSLYFNKFKPQLIEDLVFYRKNGNIEEKIIDYSIKKPFKSNSKKDKKVKILPPSLQKPTASTLNTPLNRSTTTNELEIIERMANTGFLEEAKKLAENHLQTDQLNPKLYFLLGNICLEMGKTSDAEKYFQKAIYLKPDYVMAHFHLGNVYGLMNKNRESYHFYQNVLTFIRHCKPEEEVADSDGLKVKQFRQMVEKIIEMNKAS